MLHFLCTGSRIFKCNRMVRTCQVTWLFQFQLSYRARHCQEDPRRRQLPPKSVFRTRYTKIHSKCIAESQLSAPYWTAATVGFKHRLRNWQKMPMLIRCIYSNVAAYNGSSFRWLYSNVVALVATCIGHTKNHTWEVARGTGNHNVPRHFLYAEELRSLWNGGSLFTE